MGDALDLFVTAQVLLDVAVDSLATLPATDALLQAAPGRQYVSPHAPVVDCEQVVAWVAYLEEGDVNETPGIRGMTGRVNVPTLALMVVRCVPPLAPGRSGRVVAPAADTLTAVARQTSADAWVVWEGLNTARKGGRFDLCSHVQVGRATPLEGMGGMCGWQFPIQVQIDGYPVELGS